MPPPQLGEVLQEPPGVGRGAAGWSGPWPTRRSHPVKGPQPAVGPVGADSPPEPLYSQRMLLLLSTMTVMEPEVQLILTSTTELWFYVSSAPDCFCGPGSCVLRTAAVLRGKSLLQKENSCQGSGSALSNNSSGTCRAPSRLPSTWALPHLRISSG